MSDWVATELQLGHTMEFDTSRISSVCVQEMQQLGYFGDGVGRVLGAEEIPELEGKLVVFEAFFVAGLYLPAHRFVAKVLRRFEVQIHQLTPNAVVALTKYVWAVASYSGQPSVEVFAKNYCLHWQKRKIGSKIAQFGSYTFTPRTGKTSTEVVEIVPCARMGTWRSMPLQDAVLGRSVGAKSCLRFGSTGSEPGRFCARNRGRGLKDCRAIRAEDGDLAELGHSRF
jgi:hypothetical protein